MKQRIYKTILVILFLGVCLFLIAQFKFNNNLSVCVLAYNLVNANEIKDTAENKVLNNNKVAKQTTHFFTVETIKIILLDFFLPGGSICCFIFRKKSKEILKTIRKYFYSKSIECAINDAYEKGNKELLAKTLLDNALASASSSEPQTKRTGIQTLSQYTEDKALFGLISILSNEKDIAFVYCIINALSRVVKKRIKNSEH